MQSHVQNSTASDAEQTYFDMFSLPRKLTIDTAALERDFYKLSRQLHPDLYARKSAEEQAWSLRQSSLLNDAYRTLKDPVARTAYLLKLEGIRMEDENTENQDRHAKQNRVPADLLEEVFELNMQLEELRMNKKMGENDSSLAQEVQSAKQQLQTRNDSLIEELRSTWSDWDALIDRGERGENVLESDRTQVRNRMVDVLNRRSYIRNLLRDVDAVLES